MKTDKSLRDLFDAALERDEPAERERFLDDACGTDSSLREKLARLLLAREELGDFMAQPSRGPANLDSDPNGHAGASLTEKPGDKIGRYKLLQQIGEGGCGVVYMAEQEEPVRRRVALKVIKLGMDTKEVIARFEAERQALAMMDHPNIARVLDAGATDSGRPFFVMELVRGTKITEFCDENQLSTRERIDLLLKACSAIQHAHQKGVIHRDVKPSNILVTTVDGVAVPKVIDFGIAKATNNQPLTNKTLFTAYEQFIGTPAYMSPEQAEMSGVDIDTRTDIYSLGVVLYELLTGGPPFDQRELLAAGLDRMRRTIREEEPPRPSNRLNTMAADVLTRTAHHRHTEPPKLIHQLRGELDWIVMKCLEKDRGRRYETVSGLAGDIRHYLNDEPVLACPPSLGYRFRKLARRNYGALAVASLVLFFLVLLGSGVGWVVRDRAAREAAITQDRTNREAELNREREARRAKAEGQIESIFAEVNRLEGEQKWEEALVAARWAEAVIAGGETEEATAQRVRERLKDLEFIDRLEQLELGPGSVRADEKGSPLRKDQDYAQAFRDYGVDIDELGVEPSIQRLTARPELAMPLGAAFDNWAFNRGSHRMDETGRERLVAVANGVDPEPMRVLVRSASTPENMAEIRRLADSIDPKTHHPLTLNRLGAAIRGSGSNTELEPAVRLLRRAQAVYPDNIRITVTLIQTLLMQKDYEEAVRFATALVALQPQQGYPWVALVQREWGKLDDAEAASRMTIEFARNSKEAAQSYISLSGILMLQEKPDEAIAAGRKAVELLPSSETYRSLGGNLSKLGRLDEALEVYRKFVEIYPSSGSYRDLALTLKALNRPDEADAAFDRAIEIQRKVIESDPSHEPYHWLLFELLSARNKWSEAIDAARQANEFQKHSYNYFALGHSLAMLEQWDEAVAPLREAIERNPTYADAYSNLGYVLSRIGKRDEAITAFRKTIELDPNRANDRLNLILALCEQGWGLISNPDPNLRDPVRAIEVIQEAVNMDPQFTFSLQYLGWAQYRLGDWRTSIETLEESCRLQGGGTGDAGQWIVLALAHERLVAEVGLPEKEREHHKQEARRLYEQAEEQIDSWYGDRPEGASHQAIWDFREEARKLIGAVPQQELKALRQQRWDRELATLSDEVQAEPDNLGALTNRARLYVRSGRFEQAVSDFDRLVQLVPANHWHWYCRGCLLAYLGRETEYRDHCRAMLEQFAHSKELGVLDRTTKTALLLPGGAGGDVRELFERALKSQPPDPDDPWFGLLMGMAEFRGGGMNDAIPWLEKCRSADAPARSATAEAFLAMAHHRLGDEDEAAAALARCVQRIERDLPAAGKDDLNVGGIENWLIARVARREAEEVLKKNPEEQKHDLKKSN